jgi:hypothetical protein
MAAADWISPQASPRRSKRSEHRQARDLRRRRRTATHAGPCRECLAASAESLIRYIHNMAAKCTICSHPEREAIDRALVEGESLRSILERCSTSSDPIAMGSLHRHKSNNHVPQQLAKAQEAKEVSAADDLIGHVLALTREATEILREARDAKDHSIALKAIARLEKQIELLAKLKGELDDRATVNILNIGGDDLASMRQTLAERLEGSSPALPPPTQAQPLPAPQKPPERLPEPQVVDAKLPIRDTVSQTVDRKAAREAFNRTWQKRGRYVV